MGEGRSRGAIIGQTTADNPTDKNTFLIWEGGDVADFQLTFKYKMDAGNSGAQIRSQIVEGYRVHGYQADFDSKNSYTGIWYDEGGRGILVPRCKKVTIDNEGQKTVTDGGWPGALQSDFANDPATVTCHQGDGSSIDHVLVSRSIK